MRIEPYEKSKDVSNKAVVTFTNRLAQARKDEAAQKERLKNVTKLTKAYEKEVQTHTNALKKYEAELAKEMAKG